MHAAPVARKVAGCTRMGGTGWDVTMMPPTHTCARQRAQAAAYTVGQALSSGPRVEDLAFLGLDQSHLDLWAVAILQLPRNTRALFTW